ncbi:MAG: META domain-containing protein, partial [Treponema sp.]|nr:META domain-containing protein [Treponema sp.]
CAGSPKFSDLLGKEWRLIEIRTGSSSIVFDRSRLASEGFGEIFTLNFDAERISGTGAPNRYFASYKPGTDKDRTISVNPVAGTLMAPIVEPEKLKEREFFACLQNAYKWDINRENLELSTKGPDDREAVMVFTLN